MNIESYSKSRNIPSKYLDGLWDGTTYVQEKVDGSQISWMLDENGVLQARSRKQPISLVEGEGGMFSKAVTTILGLEHVLRPGRVYRGEYLSKPKHNKLRYGRVPYCNIVLFDVELPGGGSLTPHELMIEAGRLGLDVAPLLATLTEEPTPEFLDSLLNTDSILGRVKIEGFVVKNYNKRNRDGKVMMGKYVSPDFKEMNTKSKGKSPSAKTVDEVIETYRTESRWDKAIQHLSENAVLTGEMKDLSLLMKEINTDILEEHGDEIKELLFKQLWKPISKGITRGFPEYYRRHIESGDDE